MAGSPSSCSGVKTDTVLRSALLQIVLARCSVALATPPAAWKTPVQSEAKTKGRRGDEPCREGQTSSYISGQRACPPEGRMNLVRGGSSSSAVREYMPT